MQTLAKFQVTTIPPMQDVRKNRFTQIYRDLNGDAMLVPIQMGTNMEAGNQQKHLSLSFVTKAWIYLSRNWKTLR